MAYADLNVFDCLGGVFIYYPITINVSLIRCLDIGEQLNGKKK